MVDGARYTGYNGSTLILRIENWTVKGGSRGEGRTDEQALDDAGGSTGIDTM